MSDINSETGLYSGEGVFLRTLSPDEARRFLAGLPRTQWNPIPECRVEWRPYHLVSSGSPSPSRSRFSGPWFYQAACRF
jgi:hypothetical protein